MPDKNKRILFISYDGMTDPLGQSQVIPYLSGLTKYGYEFTILSCEKPSQYAANKEYVLSLLKPFGIKWEPIPYHKNPPVLSSAYDFFKLKQAAKKLHLKYRFDMVHNRNSFAPLVSFWLNKKYGIPYLNDIRGFWADERVDGGMWDIKNPVYKFIYAYFKKREIECMNAAAYNICLTHKAEEEIHRWPQIINQPLPIKVIPCSVDIDLFNPDRLDLELRQKLQAELSIKEGDFIISYLGSIGGWYLTNEMMRFCKLVSDKIPAAKFLFISPNSHPIIAEAAARVGLNADRLIVKKGKRHEIPALLSFSKYSLFFIKQCYSKISSSPTKHGETMAMGIPVITGSGIGDVDGIITKYNSGYIVRDFSDEAFAQTIECIQSANHFDAKKIREGAIEYYSLDKALVKYNEAYKKILG
jgi:glycosyltransferase involved in cell wall biosynthesis